MIGHALCNAFSLDQKHVLDLDYLAQAIGKPPICFTHDGMSVKSGPGLERYGQLTRDKSAYQDNRVLFMIRDPRDVMVSTYFQKLYRTHNPTTAAFAQAVDREFLPALIHAWVYNQLHEDAHAFAGSLSRFIRDPRFGVRRFIEFCNVWHANRHIPRAFLLMSYEEMQQDTLRALRQAMEFICGSCVPEAYLIQAVEAGEFENMRRLEESQALGHKVLAPADENNQEAYKTRRGKVGGYTDYLTAEDVRYIDRVIREMGCPFIDENLALRQAAYGS